MATPRLPFLYPNLFRAVRACQPSTYRSIRTPPTSKPARKAKFHSSCRRRQEAYQSRYGPAATPQSLPPPPKPMESLQPKPEQPKPEQPKPEQPKPEQPKKKEAIPAESQEDVEAEAHGQRTRTDSQPPKVAEDKIAEENPEPRPEDTEPLGNKELDIVLSIPSPSEIKGHDTQRHPHLEASPYEHHFDTYSLVQQLADRAYNIDQAITLMKAIRLMLATNLDVAKEGLVSKSDTENETYLFRAACSELRTTLQTTRHSETLKQRSQRAQLQHEYDILNQKVTQEMMTMREELKGMFNDRKMGLEEEKRKIDGRISELNYQITVLLNSDAKSEVEGLRWVLTRRAALAIGIAAFMIISSLNYSSIKVREREEAEKKRAAARKMQNERADQRFTTPSRAQGTQTDSGTPARDYEESLG